MKYRNADLDRQIEQAAQLYREFTGHEPQRIRTLDLKLPRVMMQVGTCDGILYTTVRDGEVEHYIHRFKKSARPLLCTSSDGRQLVLLRGAYRFTDRGITDD
jgi:hypothetical protein